MAALKTGVHTPPVALLMGVPVSFREFIARVGESDWLRKFDRADGDRNAWLADRWQSDYGPVVAQPLAELAALAQSLGADVRTGATLPDLRAVTAAPGVVIVFSHWKGPELVKDDFIGSPGVRAFLTRAETDPSPLAAWVRDRLRSLADEEENEGEAARGWSLRRVFQPRPRFHTIREILSEAIEKTSIPGQAPEKDGADVVLESQVARFARRRADLDRLFHGLLRPGNRLELFDGLHSTQDVEAALKDGFTGTLDLTTCSSTVLADYIGAKRGQRIRTVQFPTVQELAWHAQCVALTLQMVVDHGTDYQEARRNAMEIVTRAVLQLAPQPE